MKLFDRRAGRRTGDASTEAGTRLAYRPVVKPEDLYSVPGWQQIPLTEPLLSPMPFVIDRRFDESLPSWTPLEKFVEPLGHVVSETAPSGLVEAPTVDAAPENAAPDDELILWNAPTPGRVVAPPGRAVPPAETTAPARVARRMPPSGRAAAPMPARIVPVAGGPAHAPAVRESTAVSPTGSHPGSVRDHAPSTSETARKDAEFEPTRTFLTATPPAELPLRQIPAVHVAEPPLPGEMLPLAQPAQDLVGVPAPISELRPMPSDEQTSVVPLVTDLEPERTLLLPATQAARAAEPPASTSIEVPVAEKELPRQQQRPKIPRGARIVEPPAPVVVPLVGERATSTKQTADQPNPIPARRSGLGPPLPKVPETARSLNAPISVPRIARPTQPASPGQQTMAVTQAVEPAGIGGPAGDRPETTKEQPRQGPGEPAVRPAVAVPHEPLPHIGVKGTDQVPAGQASDRLPVGTRAAIRPKVVTAGMALPRAIVRSLPPVVLGAAPAELSDLAERIVPLISIVHPPEMSEATVSPEADEEAPVEGRTVREAIGQRHGVDLMSVPVLRGPAESASARQIGAKAYTSPGVVVIPRDIGSLDSGPGRGVLAHELTHVAQRAQRGGLVPPEHTPGGRTMEEKAVAAELYFAAPTTRSGAKGTAQRPSTGTSFIPSPSEPASARPVGKPRTPLVTAKRPMKSTPPSSPGPSTPLPAPSGPTLSDLANELSEVRASLEAKTSAVPSPPAAPVQRMPETSASLAGLQPPPSGQDLQLTPNEKPNDVELARLARLLYPLISHRIRGELRENRERAGLLTDHYGRW